MIFLNNLYNIVSSTEESSAAARFKISLIPESEVFRAHFPGEPIMPGACILQVALELYNRWKQCEAEISKVTNLKFLSVISPDKVTKLNVSIEIKKQEEGQTSIKVDFYDADTEYTKMSLQLHP